MYDGGVVPIGLGSDGFSSQEINDMYASGIHILVLPVLMKISIPQIIANHVNINVRRGLRVHYVTLVKELLGLNDIFSWLQ